MRTFAVYIALTFSYVIAGKLGLLLAVPPGYATAIFPPSGIAIAAMLVGGAATLPWTFLGSLLLNAWEGYALNVNLDWTGLIVAGVIAASSALQAGVAGPILRRALGNPVALDNARDLRRFVLLSPLCCLISATLSLSGMLALGVVRTSELASSWITWWVGDTLGLLLMLPLVLVLAGEPRALWRGRTFPVAVPMLLFFTLFVVIFARVSAWEREQSLLEFRLVSQQVADNIDARLNEQAVFLDQLERSIARRSPVPRRLFHSLIESLTQRFPVIKAVEWAPAVSAAERASFEAAQRGELPGFTITERDASGKMRPGAARAQYYPVTYVEPLAGNEEAAGFDLASDAARRTAIESALDGDVVVATAPIRLAQEHETQWGMLLVRALEDGANGPGVVLVVLRMGDFLRALIDPVHSMINISLIDTDSNAALFDNITGELGADRYERSFAFGTRHYIVRTVPTVSYFAAHRAWQSWSVLAVGVLSTGLLGVLLMLGTGQTHRFERLVAERTRDLEISHERLRKEFAERRRTEAALRQAQKMEAVGQLTGGIAHDFNNLLTVILGNLELLKGRVTDERARGLLEVAERGAERGAHLTQSLLAFSRRQVLRPEPVDANRIIVEFAPLLRQATDGFVELECRLSCDPCPCVIDNVQFQSALLNLVKNARDAMMRAGGRIIVETANLAIAEEEVQALPRGGYVVVTFTDNGSGMSEDVAERAFEPFYTTKEVGKGSGLGLSQVYGFAQQSGGLVQLDSTEGIGTTVRLYLPRSEGVGPTLNDDDILSKPPLSAEHAEMVLVVDDDAEVLSTTAGMVSELGYRVLMAKDGPTALALIETDTLVDLLLTDYVMPSGMTGDVLARRAKERRPNIKVLLISGYSMMVQRNAPEELPLLHKPYRQDILARAIRAALKE